MVSYRPDLPRHWANKRNANGRPSSIEYPSSIWGGYIDTVYSSTAVMMQWSVILYNISEILFSFPLDDFCFFYIARANAIASSVAARVLIWCLFVSNFWERARAGTCQAERVISMCIDHDRKSSRPNSSCCCAVCRENKDQVLHFSWISISAIQISDMQRDTQYPPDISIWCESPVKDGPWVIGKFPDKRRDIFDDENESRWMFFPLLLWWPAALSLLIHFKFPALAAAIERVKNPPSLIPRRTE
jgi:hypothetical protein